MRLEPPRSHWSRRVRTDLPTWIEEAPVDLDPTQIAALSATIGDHLDALVAGNGANGLFSTIELGRADRLRTTLLRWATLGPDRRSIQAARLTEAQRLRVELQQVEEALMEIEVGSQANLETYRKVVAEIAKIEDRIAEYNQRKGVLQGKINELAVTERELEGETETSTGKPGRRGREESQSAVLQRGG